LLVAVLIKGITTICQLDFIFNIWIGDKNASEI